MAAERKSRFLGAILVPTITIILFFLLIELFLRVHWHESMEFDIEMWKYATRIKVVADDPNIGHVHRPNSSLDLMGVNVSINDRGLRDFPFSYGKTPGNYRILMLGDSLTFGWGVEVEDTPSKILERSLNASGGPDTFEVINTGVGNYNTSMQVNYFKSEGIKYNPDLVILNYFINDAEPIPGTDISFLSKYSYAFTYLIGRIDALKRQFLGKKDWKEYYSDLYDENAPGWLRAQEAIAELKKLTDSASMRLILVNYPELRILDNYPFNDVREKLKATASVGGMPYIDLYPTVEQEEPSTLWVTRPDPHPNAKANHLFSHGILDGLKLHYPDVFDK